MYDIRTQLGCYSLTVMKVLQHLKNYTNKLSMFFYQETLLSLMYAKTD